MTKQEMKDKFEMLYGIMASSNNPQYMHTFGEVMKQMMAWMIEYKPETAESYIESLCSIQWRQFLTRREAMEVVSKMIPPAPWDYETWYRVMEDMNLEWQRDGVFNRYALWVAMNQIYTDFGNDIAKLMGKPLSEIPNNVLVPAVHNMAISLLTDADKKYCIRKYHLGE